MPSSHLQHYLRTHRKLAGFSQKELAYLLASEGALSRYENYSREPSLRTALACEVIFHVSVSELFAGMYTEVEKDTLSRVRHLSEHLHTSDPPHPRHQARRAKVEGVLLALLAELQQMHAHNDDA